VWKEKARGLAALEKDVGERKVGVAWHPMTGVVWISLVWNAILAWLIPSLTVYAMGRAVAWIRRGFVPLV
jgi:hypothetical protein